MSELYTKFMERISPFLSQNWQMFVIAVGLLFLLGAVFNWKWLCNPHGSNPLGFLAFVYRHFGEKAHRVAVGIVSIVIIACGALLWVVM